MTINIKMLDDLTGSKMPQRVREIYNYALIVVAYDLGLEKVEREDIDFDAWTYVDFETVYANFSKAHSTKYEYGDELGLGGSKIIELLGRTFALANHLLTFRDPVDALINPDKLGKINIKEVTQGYKAFYIELLSRALIAEIKDAQDTSTEGLYCQLESIRDEIRSLQDWHDGDTSDEYIDIQMNIVGSDFGHATHDVERIEQAIYDRNRPKGILNVINRLKSKSIVDIDLNTRMCKEKISDLGISANEAYIQILTEILEIHGNTALSYYQDTTVENNIDRIVLGIFDPIHFARSIIYCFIDSDFFE